MNPQQAPKVPLKISNPLSADNEGVQMVKSIAALPLNVVKAIFNPLQAPKIITDLVPKSGPLTTLKTALSAITSPLKTGFSTITGTAIGGGESAAVDAMNTAMSAGIKGLDGAGSATDIGGKVLGAKGSSLMAGGKAASSTLIGAIIGVPMLVVGAAAKVTGAGAQATGKAMKLTAKALKVLQPLVKKAMEMAVKAVKLAIQLAKLVARAVQTVAKVVRRPVRATVRTFKGSARITSRKRKTIERPTAPARTRLAKLAHAARMVRYRAQQVAHAGKMVRYRVRQATAVPRAIVRRGTHILKAGGAAVKKVAAGANTASDASQRVAHGDLAALKDAATPFRSTGVRGHLRSALQAAPKEARPTRPVRPVFRKPTPAGARPSASGLLKEGFKATRKALKGACKMTSKPLEPVRMSVRAARDLKARAFAPAQALKSLGGAQDALGQGDLSKALQGVHGAAETGARIGKAPALSFPRRGAGSPGSSPVLAPEPRPKAIVQRVKQTFPPRQSEAARPQAD